MFRQYYLLVIFLALLGGCTFSQNLNHIHMADMKQSYTQFDMKLAWNIYTTGTETRIEGLIINTWATPVTDVEIWVSLLDSNAKTIARKSFFVPGTLEKNETAPFSIMLPIRAETGSKLIFTYSYNPHSGGDSDRWMQSFETSIPADTTLKPGNLPISRSFGSPWNKRPEPECIRTVTISSPLHL